MNRGTTEERLVSKNVRERDLKDSGWHYESRIKIRDFQSRWQTVVTPSHEQIRITTKLQNSHLGQLPEVWLNGNPTTEGTEKKSPTLGW